jgi:hypothetical protein
MISMKPAEHALSLFSISGLSCICSYLLPSVQPQLFSRSQQNGLMSTGRIVHPQWIDRRVLRDRMQQCHQLHDEKCASYPPDSVFSAFRSAFLVDVWLQCIVPGAAIDSYIALSYVWGEGKLSQQTAITLLNFNLRSLSPWRTMQKYQG